MREQKGLHCQRMIVRQWPEGRDRRACARRSAFWKSARDVETSLRNDVDGSVQFPGPSEKISSARCSSAPCCLGEKILRVRDRYRLFPLDKSALTWLIDLKCYAPQGTAVPIKEWASSVRSRRPPRRLGMTHRAADATTGGADYCCGGPPRATAGAWLSTAA